MILFSVAFVIVHMHIGTTVKGNTKKSGNSFPKLPKSGYQIILLLVN